MRKELAPVSIQRGRLCVPSFRQRLRTWQSLVTLLKFLEALACSISLCTIQSYVKDKYNALSFPVIQELPCSWQCRDVNIEQLPTKGTMGQFCQFPWFCSLMLKADKAIYSFGLHHLLLSTQPTNLQDFIQSTLQLKSAKEFRQLTRGAIPAL